MDWYNEPPYWKADGSTITIKTGDKTDFWRKTHDGGIRDTGHFYFSAVTGDFVAEVKFSADYHTLYDQAGLMVRLDDSNWLKCGIEFYEDMQHVSAVVTRDFSDWSVLPLPEPPAALWLRIVRKGYSFDVHYSLDGSHYIMVRQAYLTHAPTVDVGVMCCSPIGGGLTVVLENFAVHQE
jgi:regulation of enolase protein 1 (concanavalin A-like superfamily)